MEIKRVPISEVEVWEKNLLTRTTDAAGYNRTKKQIVKLDVYKPLVVFREDGKYKVLGGRTRYHVLKDLGHSEVDVSIVKPKTEAEKWEYALSDNDHSGDWIEDKLAGELFPLQEEIDLEDYRIDVGQSVSLKNVLEEFGSDFIPKEREVDENIPTENVCPKCGYRW